MNHLPSQPHTASNTAMARYSSMHGNSSAFSASAGPNEDWTKISDLAERRRIQNRIAQRNYRKKLKRRLEDLERRAASSSASPEPTLGEQHSSSLSSTGSGRGRAHTLAALPSASNRRTSIPTFSQHHNISSSYDDATSFPYQQRHQSPAPSSIFSQPAFSSAEASYTPSYSFSSSYPSPSTTAAEASCYGTYMLPRPAPLPSLSGDHSAVKNEQLDDELSNFTLHYLPGGLDLTKSGLYREAANPTPYTPPLSESIDSFPSSIMGSPPDLWALYPSPPASVAEDDPPIFSLPLDLALDEPDFFKSF